MNGIPVKLKRRPWRERVRNAYRIYTRLGLTGLPAFIEALRTAYVKGAWKWWK